MTNTYTIEWCEVTKEGETNGRPWKITSMTLVDKDGVKTEKVSTFDSVVNGTTLEGEIVTNDKGYLNFKKSSERKPNMDRLMDKKSGQIAEAQTRKEQSIEKAQDRSAWMWAKNNASTLLASHIDEYMDNNNIADRVIDLATKIYNGEPTEPFNS